MLSERLFSALTRLASIGSGNMAYAGAATLTLSSLFLLPRLEIHTTRQGMVRDDLPVQADFLAYMEDFGSPTQLVAVLEGETEAIKRASDEIAEKLSSDPEWVRNVFHRIDVDRFRRAGLYFLSVDDLEAVREFLSVEPVRARTLLIDRDLPAVLALAQWATADAGEDLLTHPSLDLAVRFLEKWAAVLREGGEGVELEMEQAVETLAGSMLGAGTWIDPEGYLLSRDRRMAFLFIQQAKSTDEASFVVPFMTHVRTEVAAALADQPGIAAGFTGWPAAIEEDYTLLITDLPRVSLLATGMILAIFLGAFRSLYRTLLVFVPLVCGVLWTLGLTALVLGHLNYLSSVFVGILFGLGIDFGIYFIRRFDEERLGGAAPLEAVHRTLDTAGRGIVTGGLTAVISFLALGATDQPAFAELGIVAGMGVGLVLLSTLLLLPPLLVRFPPRLNHDRAKVDSVILEKTARTLLRRPSIVVLFFAAGALALTFHLPRLGFDYDLNNLLPKDSESLRVLRDMEKRSPYTDQFISVIADDLEHARRLHAALEALPTVSRVESLARVIPPSVDVKKRILEEVSRLLPERTPVDSTPPHPTILRERLEPFIAQLEESEEDLFSAGRADEVSRVNELLTPIRSIEELLGGPEATKRQADFERALFASRDRLVDPLYELVATEPLTLERLDPGIRERFVGRSGKTAVLVFPTEPIWEPAFLDRFVSEVRGAAESVLGAEAETRHRVTGFAVTYQVTAPAIRRGFNQATLAAGIIVTLILLLDLRRLPAALAALTPLLATTIFLLGGMAWAGAKLTMATQTAFPILFGLGVAYGVHMVHRLSEKRGDEASRAVGTTGKAIGLAAATTMAGFGAMMTADHSALVAFGTVLFLGIIVSAATALLLVPALVTVLRSRF